MDALLRTPAAIAPILAVAGPSARSSRCRLLASDLYEELRDSKDAPAAADGRVPSLRLSINKRPGPPSLQLFLVVDTRNQRRWPSGRPESSRPTAPSDPRATVVSRKSSD